MFIEQPAFYLRWLYPQALWRMDQKEKAVYLTFDDGPIPGSTPWILDCLAQYHAKATFFMVGDNVRKYPDLLERVKHEGHRIGNHSFHHLAGHLHSVSTYLNDVEKANALLQTDLFRPPYGWMRLPQYLFLKRHYRIVMWDVVTRDYSKYLRATEVFENVKRYTRSGSIITFHDSLKSIEKLHAALPLSLEWLQNEGYAFKVF